MEDRWRDLGRLPISITLSTVAGAGSDSSGGDNSMSDEEDDDDERGGRQQQPRLPKLSVATSESADAVDSVDSPPGSPRQHGKGRRISQALLPDDLFFRLGFNGMSSISRRSSFRRSSTHSIDTLGAPSKFYDLEKDRTVSRVCFPPYQISLRARQLC